MERIGVILAVGNAGDLAVYLLIHADESAGKSFCGSCEQAEIETGLFALVVHALSHAGDDVKTQLLRLGGFAVMYADKRLKALCKSDESHGESAVLEYLGNAVVLGELL